METTPLELKVYKFLQPRMHLSVSEKTKQQNLFKGYEGEKELFNQLKKHLPSDYICMNDILLESNQTEFQIDILVIGEKTIYPLEVKNYEGDFMIENDSWYVASSQNEIRNPLHQLKRMEVLLKNVLKYGKLNFHVEPYIIFTHPEFYLYKSPSDLPLIFPTQVMRFMRKLTSTPFHRTAHHTNLVGFLEDQRIHRSTYERLPTYEYEDLKKGIVCEKCSEFLSESSLLKLICKKCRKEERIETAIRRNVAEFMTLFPRKKVTTNAIYEWCDIIQSKKSIRRVLKKYLTAIGTGKQTYYINK